MDVRGFRDGCKACAEGEGAEEWGLSSCVEGEGAEVRE
jgi:hypothetical protein